MISRYVLLVAVSAILSAFATFHVAARDLPDLTITAVDLHATGDCSGRAPLITGSVRVTNVGQGQGQIFTTKVMLASQLKNYPEVLGNDRFVNTMRPRESVTVPVRIRSNNTPKLTGMHKVRLTVDPENVFEEENEYNNQASAQVALDCP
ncbi:MAG: CARDB domain-containing protein [Hyphomicrobiaceae bacterium]